MLLMHRREPVVAFIRPSKNERQPVPQAFWLSKGGEFLMPTHLGRESASVTTSLPVRQVMTRHPNSSAALFALAAPEMSGQNAPPGTVSGEQGHEIRPWKPRMVRFSKSVGS
jgi:hypothetical protein